MRPPHCQRTALWLICCLLAAIGSVLPLAAEPSRHDGVMVRSSGPDRFQFELTVSDYRLQPSRALTGTSLLAIDGFTTRSRPGEPALPARKYLIALPPAGAYNVSARVLEEVALGSVRLQPVAFPKLIRGSESQPMLTEEYRLEESVYTGAAVRPLVESDAPAFIRHQRIVPLWINPARYDPASGELSLATRILVEVTFPAWRADGAPRRPLGNDGWNRIYSQVLLNPDVPAEWRSRPVQRPQQGPGMLQQPLPDNLMKIRIRESGMCRIRAADLVSNGFPSGENFNNLRLFKRGYDPGAMIPIMHDVAFSVEEDAARTNGVFDGNDYLVFFGQRLRDDASRNDPIEKFADHNIYWLGTAAGTMMAEVTLPRGFLSGDTATAFFPVEERYEQDLIFLEQTPRYAYGDPPLLQDSYYHSYGAETELVLPFRVHAIRPGSTLQLHMEITGGTLANTDIRQLVLSIVNATDSIPLNSAFVSGNNIVNYTSQPVAAARLAEGTNRFRIEPPRPGRSLIEAVLNRFSIEYESLYRAGGNRLSFTTGALTGDTTISVTGLSTTDLRLYEVSDPDTPSRCLLEESHFINTGSDIVLSFRDNIPDRKSYVLTPFDAIRAVAPEDIAADISSSIIGGTMEAGVDILVVAHGDYLAEMQRWVDYRRAQGYRVLLVDVEDLYDEFTGGVPSAYAVKYFIERYYQLADASAVLLVGDASEDAKRVDSDSAENFVPTQTYPERINAPPFKEDEVVTTDKWYVLLGNDFLPAQGDFYPDLLIGRLPAGDIRELRAMLDKIFLFETPGASDFWRRRMIHIADDAWSGITEACYRFGEDDFQNGEEMNAQVIEGSVAGGFDIVRFYLGDYTDDIHPSSGECISYGVVQNHTRTHATPALLTELAAGATLVSIQSHMNRYLVTHEQLFTSSSAVPGGQDHKRVENFFKPFIAFGMGCHLSDYALHSELSRWLVNDVNGDCINERLLFLANRGAVATYGSSGFEYLGENNSFTNQIYRTFFNTPPVDTMIASDRAQARWIFGEVIAVSEILGATTGQTRRYHLLGDPMLRIDAGPPRFTVQLNGTEVTSGSLVNAVSSSDTIFVDAVVSDENAIEKFELFINGVDESELLQKTALVDTNLSAARKYRITFRHKLLPQSYDIVLRALQAPDTTAGQYHVAAEFVLTVPLDITYRVNGRRIVDGDLVPVTGDYQIDLRVPIAILAEDIDVMVDDVPVAALSRTHPAPDDSTTWILRFTQSLTEGEHTIAVFMSGSELRRLTVQVSLQPGITQLIPYPNPFADDTYFVFNNQVEISDGQIDIFTVSGKRIASVPIPVTSRQPGQNAVYWDGRDHAGDAVANGVYLYIATIIQSGERYTVSGKLARMK